MRPSRVLFLSWTDRSDPLLEFGGLIPGGYEDGKEDADVLAGMFRRPKGALWLLFDIRRIVPGLVGYYQFNRCLVESAAHRHIFP